jgi:hypothetical protein
MITAKRYMMIFARMSVKGIYEENINIAVKHISYFRRINL